MNFEVNYTRTFNNLQEIMKSFIEYVGLSVVANSERSLEIAERAVEIINLYNCSTSKLAPEILGDLDLSDLNDALKIADNLFTRIDNLKAFVNKKR